jgi:hypothetical protein
MDIVTLDFETFYGDGYTLSGKDTTTESYVRDPRFEAIMCSFKIDDGASWWVPRDDIARQLADLQLDKRAVLCHHAHFDCLILNHHYSVRPKRILDTLGMARALHGANGRLALAKLAERYGIGVKGTEVLNARNMRFADFTPAALARYGEYCCNDADLTYELATRMIPQFSKDELTINDSVIRMFTEPTIVLDIDMLQKYAASLQADKMAAMLAAGAQREDLMSNPKFAMLLEELGIEPPMKVSPTTGKLTFAFAKTDSAMQILQEHPDERVQFLVEARLKNKTTIAEKGAERLIAMAGRGAATVYLKYSGASGTHRCSGGDKFNWQSMKRGSDLRKAVMAPPGSMVVVGDSSNIEARVLDWLAGQDDMVEVYRANDAGLGPDKYCMMAERIYGRPVVKGRDNILRQVGKVSTLGLGFSMGHEKFIAALRGSAKGEDGKPMLISTDFSKKIVDIYRSAHPQVVKLWKRGAAALEAIARGQVGMAVDYQGVVKTCKDGLLMPGGLRIMFPELQFDRTAGQYGEWTFWNGKMRERMYGGKVIENCIAEGTEVLTHRGWVSIGDIRLSDYVHDGVEFVRHGGIVDKSVQNCVMVDGVWMTPDHKVLTDDGWKIALEKPKPFRPNLRGADCIAPGGQRREKEELGVRVPMRCASIKGRVRRDSGSKTWGHAKLWVHEQSAGLCKKLHSRDVEASYVWGMAQYVGSLSAAITQGFQKLWGAWDSCLRAMERIVPEFLGGHGANLCARVDLRAYRQQPGVLPRELHMGSVGNAGSEPARQSAARYTQIIQGDRDTALDTVLPSAKGATAHRVFDILNAGPRQRFVVRGAEGAFVVHNCVQCLARIIVFSQCQKTAKELAGIAKWVHSVHDEGLYVAGAFDAPFALETLLGNMRSPPAWAPTLPLNSEGGMGQRYGDAK